MADGNSDIAANTHAEWLAHVQPTGLVVAASVLDDLVSAPTRQTAVDNAEVLETLEIKDARAKDAGAYIADAWGFASKVLGWEPAFVAGVDGGPPLPDVEVVLEAQGVTLRPDWVVVAKARDTAPENWLLFVNVLPPDAGLDKRGDGGWEATPSQQMERLLRETGAPAGLIIGGRNLRLITAPRGESSGWMDFPVQALTEVAGRPMLSGLKQLVGKWGLYLAPKGQNLRDLIAESRRAQANVSKDLAAQVLGALHALLRGLNIAMPHRLGQMAADPERSHHLYEGLLTVLMRLVFLLYAEDRDLLPSTQSGPALELYDRNYSVRGLLAKLEEDEARYPATMVDRVGAWGRLLALFRLVYEGDRYGWIQARGGKLFDPDAFPFLEARERPETPASVPRVSDACVLEILRSLMRLKGDRLSYRTLDVEQIGSVYETVMGFTVQPATGPSLAIQAGKKNHTPVFVDLAKLTAEKPGDRLKWLKTHTDRDKYPAAIEASIKTASNADELAAAFEGGRGVVDERGSPGKRIVKADTPILQPTDERRRTGSHYTPRSLTEPIVRHALQPTFERLGPDATAEQILELKVCDPAMGSGAFLVEACRQLGARLERGWERWPKSKPPIPADEDETLHARRLVAQKCLYGVDKNPMATDLARLSLWLATLARDHEFTFLDHALKSGDSLVGLTNRQIMSLSWSEGDATLDLISVHVRDRLKQAEALRARIRGAPHFFTQGDLQPIHDQAEAKIAEIRLLGDAVVAAFFSADGERARKEALGTVRERTQSGEDWRETLGPLAVTLGEMSHYIRPFHWEIEFPEVFDRNNAGFDAVIGNPPFLKGADITGTLGIVYLRWLQAAFPGAGGQSDIVALFLRHAYANLRTGGAFGLVATMTVSRGDTRSAGLEPIVASGGRVFRAIRRLPWIGEAAVTVSVVWAEKESVTQPCYLDHQPCDKITTFLLSKGSDKLPSKLKESTGMAYEGYKYTGQGFLFYDGGPDSEPISRMKEIILNNPENKSRIKPLLRGEAFLESPSQSVDRFIIDFEDFTEEKARTWPELFEIVERHVRPFRQENNRDRVRNIWWQFEENRPALRLKSKSLSRIIMRPKISSHHVFGFISNEVFISNPHVAILLDRSGEFCVLQSRIHEHWVATFGALLEDRISYTATDCLETYPFPQLDQASSSLDKAGEAYHSYRAAVMIAADEGMTKTYNRFHDPDETRPAILELRRLHDDMDHAVLAAYGWSDLIPRAVPDFEPLFAEDEEDAPTGKRAKKKFRYRWPEEVRDEVLARLLALNGERAKAQASAAGKASPTEKAARRAKAAPKPDAAWGLFADHGPLLTEGD